jgi:hypothetical protein
LLARRAARFDGGFLNLAKIACCLLLVCGTARADEPELAPEATTRNAPEELPRNNPQGKVMAVR